MQAKLIRSLEEFITVARRDTGHWKMPRAFRAWFRGQADSTKPPIPSVLRSENARKHEFELTSLFRLKAQAFGPTPETSRLDQWLILMQHHGVPTRLLDWSESPLAGLFFAVSEFAYKRSSEIDTTPGVWVLNPFELNRITDAQLKRFPNTWVPSITLENFKIPFGTAGKEPYYGPAKGKYVVFKPSQFPLAIQPSFIHARVSSQKSCFTIHGTDNSNFEAIGKKTRLISNKFLIKYRIPRRNVRKIMRQLYDQGITFSSVFPDFQNLANDLKYQFVFG